MTAALAVSVSAPPAGASEFDPGLPRPNVNVSSTRINADADDVGQIDPLQRVYLLSAHGMRGYA